MAASSKIEKAHGGKVYRIVVVGGAFAGLAAITALLDVCNARKCRYADDEEAKKIPLVRVDIEITLIDERDGYYHLIGSPMAFASEQYPEKVWRRFDEVPAIQHQCVKRLHGTVLSIDNCNQTTRVRQHDTKQFTTVPYDYLIVASGLGRQYPSVPQSKTRASYLAETRKHIDSVRNAERGVVVIGGGAVGVEMAAELKLCHPSRKVTLIHSRESLLSSENLPDDFKDRALDLLRLSGVEVLLNDRVTSTIETKDPSGKPFYTLILKDGSRFETGHVINAVSGFHPTSNFLPPSTCDDQGYIKIHASLRFSSDIDNAYYHFAAGDIAKWSGIKRCGAAIHQGHIAGVNVYLSILAQQMEQQIPFLELDHVPPMMGLAIGRQAVTFTEPEGVKWGEEQMKWYFGDDLAFDSKYAFLSWYNSFTDDFNVCWNYMQLGKEAAWER